MHDDFPIRRVTRQGREFWLDVERNKLLPVVRGGAGAPPPPTPPAPPPPPPPAPPPPPPAAPPAPDAPDLGALQAVIDSAKAEGNTAATQAMLTALGFDKVEDLQTFVTSKREADKAAMTELERRESAAAEREAAAAKKEADAATLINAGVIREALRGAGVANDNLDLAQGMVNITGDVTKESAAAAVKTLADNPALASLFAEATATPPAPGAPPAKPPTQKSTPSALDAGRERAQAELAKRNPKPANAA